MSKLDRDKLRSTLETLEKVAYRKKFFKLLYYTPYPKQARFLELGATKRERLFMAGNQLGKSETGAYETAVHLTGDYPDWWRGKRFDRPTRGWAAGVTSLDVRNIQQKKLCGTPGVDADFGTGYIPKDRFADKPSLARGVTDAFDTIQVKHKSGGISTLHFKSYEQGRQKFQGDTIDFGWGDEEGPMEVYSEFLTRLRGDGLLYTTFTPLMGKTDLVLRFMDDPSEDRAYVTMTLNEAEHFSADEKAKRLAGYPKHEREARANGVPMLGSGRIFTYDEAFISEPAIRDVPAYFAKIWGIDFGIGHPFAAVLLLWDKDNDCLHVHHAIRMADGMPINHAVPIKHAGIDVPVAWPQDGTAREKGSGETLASLYKKEGLNTLPDPAMWPEGGNSTEAGILEMDERMKNGKFKVASHLSDWFDEYRTYHRKDGQIVKVRDDLMSATRIAVMAKRFSKTVALGGRTQRLRKPGQILMADGFDMDPFTGL
jgi:phage terminase large subunit-like protein